MVMVRERRSEWFSVVCVREKIEFICIYTDDGPHFYRHILVTGKFTHKERMIY